MTAMTAASPDPLEAVIDYDCPIPNVNGRPLFVLPALSPDPNEDQQLRATLTTLHQRGRAARHLAEYARYTLDVVPALHHTLICEAIDALLDDQFDTLVVNTPPGAAKSTYTSHALCAYFMGRFPRSNIILATHTADLSEKWSRKVRNTLADPLHQHVFPESELSRDSTAVGRWATSLGGEFLAAGVGASILGFRADLCLTGNTLLRTPDGHKFISAITKGDRVLAYDPVTSTTSYQRVVATVERQTTGRIYRIHTADRRVVEATGNHPFYSAGEYISAEALTVGLPLLSAVAVPHTLATYITKIEIIDTATPILPTPDGPSAIPVYDIQVENTANFFANGILVHNCVIDDPISGFEQAQSMTQLAKVHGWYENDLMTRMKPRAKTVLICQRLARNDLAGYMMDRNAGNPHIRQRTLIFRMEAQPGDPPDGTGRSPGERLWPEWYSQEMVEDNKLDDFKWRTLYQQEPPSDTGSWVSEDEIGYVEPGSPVPTVPPDAPRYMCSDLALSVNKGDYSVHAVCAVTANHDLIVLEAWRARTSPEITVERHLDLVATHHPLESLIDDDNASKVYVQLLATRARERGVPVNYHPMPLRGQDKETRGAPLRGWFKRKKVFLVRAPWNDWLKKEILGFPNLTGAGVDDGVDALSLMGRRLSALARPAAPPAAFAPAKTVQQATLDELWADHEARRSTHRRI